MGNDVEVGRGFVGTGNGVELGRKVTVSITCVEIKVGDCVGILGVAVKGTTLVCVAGDTVEGVSINCGVQAATITPKILPINKYTINLMFFLIIINLLLANMLKGFVHK
jgi:hypothetical protein